VYVGLVVAENGVLFLSSRNSALSSFMGGHHVVLPCLI